MNPYDFLAFLKGDCDKLKEKNNFRTLHKSQLESNKIILNHKELINLSSNDYLGLASDLDLRDRFLNQLPHDKFVFSSSSSRLQTGNYPTLVSVESLLSTYYGGKGALVFSSGYHANTGILPAICTRNTVILADKLVHASIIDGMRLSSAHTVRYRHNDYKQLRQLVTQYASQADRIIVVAESIYSMDGDCTDLLQLMELKRRYNNLLLYIDEAHAVGVRGMNGLGLAEEQGVLNEIDILIGTFGKALASHGAYVICHHALVEFLINHMRSLIYTTALPPICMEWTLFVLKQIPHLTAQRKKLLENSNRLINAIQDKGISCQSASHIIPYQTGDSLAAIHKAEELQKKGFFALPVRPPTVPEGSARLRFSIRADISATDIEQLIQEL